MTIVTRTGKTERLKLLNAVNRILATAEPCGREIETSDESPGRRFVFIETPLLFCTMKEFEKIRKQLLKLYDEMTDTAD